MLLLEGAAQALAGRLRSARADSPSATEEQCAALAAALGRPLPHWLGTLLQTYPLSGAELSWQAHPPDEEIDGRSYVILADPVTMALESTELAPGRDILPLGFICIAADGDGTGDPYSSPSMRTIHLCIRSITKTIQPSTRSGRTQRLAWPSIFQTSSTC